MSRSAYGTRLPRDGGGRKRDRELPAAPVSTKSVKLTCVHPRRRLKTLRRLVLAEGRHPRVLGPRFLPEVVEALHLLLLSAHGGVLSLNLSVSQSWGLLLQRCREVQGNYHVL